MKKHNKKLVKQLATVIVIGLVIGAGIGAISRNVNNQAATAKTAAAEKKVAEQAAALKKARDSGEAAPIELDKVKTSDWDLVLVNPDTKLEKNLSAEELGKINDEFQVDNRIVASYQDLAAAAEKAGHPLVLISAYRSIEEQQANFDHQVNYIMTARGISQEEATAATKESISEPGYSEHHTGLAVDVVDQSWLDSNPPSVLEASFGETDAGKWLAANCQQYGFIIRYPEGKEAITKISYEPWHLRYVGKANAIYMDTHKLALEEYLPLVKKWEAYEN